MKFDIYSQAAVAEQSGTAILKFFATWCVPCKALTTTLKSSEFEDYNFNTFNVDVDLEPELSDAFNIKGVPTLIFLKNGEEIARLVGNVDSKEIIKTIKENLI